MAKYNFDVSGSQLIISLVPVLDDVQPTSMSYLAPSFKIGVGKINAYEYGQPRQSFLFTEIGEINGVEPTDLQDAFDELTTATANFNGGGASPYKVYTALLTQSGTDAPVAIVLENTLGNIAWSRRFRGTYEGALIGAFTENKTTIQIIAHTGQGYTANSGVANKDVVVISTSNELDIPADNVLEEYANRNQSLQLKTMTKISNQRAYIPDEEINGLDYLPGTDFDQALKTVNFRVQDLGTHYNQVNGVRNFDFNFYAHSGSNPKPADGYFYSNSNEQDPNNITYFVFSKKTARFKDATNFFESISTENPFDLIIAQKVDINTIFFFRIDSIETFSGYYKLNVSEVFFPNGKTLDYVLSYAVFNLKNEAVGPIPTKTSDLTNDGEDSTSTYLQVNKNIKNEIPLGTINGINAIFTTQFPLEPNSEDIFVNGQKQVKPYDYNISVQTITFTFSPNIDEVITINYIKQ